MKKAAILTAAVILISSFVYADGVVDFKQLPKAVQKTPVAFLTKVKTAPVIDAKLNDACWQAVEPLSPPRNTYTGLEPIEGTEFKVVYDRKNIYIAARLVENYKDRLLGKKQTKRDMYGGDNIEIFMGSDKNSKMYYQFICNVLHSSRYDGNSELGKKYDPEGWEFKIDKDSEKSFVTIEVKIPAADIERKDFIDGTSMKFNLCRTDYVSKPPFKYWPKGGRGIDYNQEISQWSITGGTNHAVDLYGDIFFGSKRQYEKLVKSLEVDVVLDREIYDGQDTFAQAVVKPVNEGAKARVQIEVFNKAKQIVLSDRKSFGDSDLTFLLPLKDFSAGDYKLSVTLVGTDGQVREKEVAFTKEIKAYERSIAKRGRIPLSLPERKTAAGLPWMVRTGIPFPKGSLWSKDNVRLLENGKEIPAQFDVRGNWSPKGSIRWLGLSFVAKMIDGMYNRYEVEFSEKIRKSGRYREQVTVSETRESITINTGPLQVQIDRKGYKGLSKVWLDKNRNRRFDKDEIAVEAGAEDAPYVEDKDGNIYLTSLSNAVDLYVEERGPAQAVVRAEGWFENKDKGKLCKYITYYEFFAGQKDVLVDHAVIVTFDTKKQRLKDVGFSVAAKGSGGFLGLDKKLIAVNRSKRAFAVQDRWNRGFVNTGVKTTGKLISPWADAGSSDLGVTLYGQYIAERFPKEFSIDKKKITYHLWPKDLGNTFTREEEVARNNVYKFFFAHEGPELNFNMPGPYFQAISDVNAKEKFDFSYTKAAADANAQGIAINEPMVIRFRDSAFDGEGAAEYAELFQKDPHAMASPEWMTGSGAFGPMVAADYQNYPELENFLNKTFLANCYAALRVNDEYGMWNFGDVHTYWYAHKNMAGLHRVWLSHHHGQTNIPWLLYAHFGEYKFLEWARINSHHTMNINIIHYADKRNPIPYHKPGNVYHVKGMLHWGGDAGAASHLAFVRYLQYKWCLTGSRRARDVGNLWVERVIEDNFDGAAGRDTVTFTGEGLEYYRNSRDPRLLAQIKHKVKPITAMPLDQQHAYNWSRTSFLSYHSMTGNRELLKKLKAPELVSQFRLFNNAAYLYLLEGDKSYLEKARFSDEECLGLFEIMRGYYSNKDDKIYDGYATNFPGGGWIAQCGQIESLFAMQAALKKAGMKVTVDKRSKRKDAVMTGRYTRAYPYPHSWWINQDGKASVTADCDCEEDKLSFLINDEEGKKVPGLAVKKSKKSCTVIPADKKGIYEIQISGKRKKKTRDHRAVHLNSKAAFVRLKKGKPYGIYKGTVLKLQKIPAAGLTIKSTSGDKHPSRLSLLDKNFNEIDFAAVWSRAPLPSGKQRTLTIPAKSRAVYLHSSMEITLVPSETIDVIPLEVVGK
ncbi:MAG: exo-rhamnogalacturonan lyase family protein [Planctomycetota bacterium]|jgi:hypothetical protein